MPRRNYGIIGLGGLLITATGACGGGAAGPDFDSIGAISSALTTYQVGSGKAYSKLQDVIGRLQPGDVVEVSGNQTYSGNIRFTAPGSASAKITIRGVPVNGKRPVLSGGTNTVEFNADHYVFENFEVTGGSSRCVFHHAGDITIRNTVIHDCPSHGILGADADAGSLTLEYSEVYRCGMEDRRHPIYMATDESAYPGAVFRMQFCYVHDGNGGNNIKSRAQRNEIYYNWIEGGYYRNLELIGPDGQSEGLAREDSDVVGNVIYQTRSYPAARLGGDGTGQTWGRYRFVNNTFIMSGSSAVFQLWDGVQSVEAHNNVFYRQGGGGVTVLDEDDVSWANGRVVSGSKNWVASGSSRVPSEWSGTLSGSNPGFVDPSGRDFRLTSSSPLRDVGNGATAASSKYPVPSPLVTPAYHPPVHQLLAVGSAGQRPTVGTIDIGAFEQGTGSTQPPPPVTEPPPPPPPQGSTTTLGATADSYVRAGSYASTNYGTASMLYTKTISTADLNRIAYLKFDLSSVSSVTSAKLRFYAELSDEGSVGTTLYPVADTSWSESGLTWNNRPALGSTQLGSITVQSILPEVFELDVSAYLKSEKAAGRSVVSFAFQNGATSDPRIDVSSRESGAQAPVLVITQ